MTVVTVLLATLIAAVLAHASWLKLARPESALASIQHGIPQLNKSVAKFVVRLIAVIEATLGALLVLPPWRGTSEIAVICGLTFLIYAAWTVRAALRRENCGCRRSPHVPKMRDISFHVALIAGCAVVAAAPPTPSTSHLVPVSLYAVVLVGILASSQKALMRAFKRLQQQRVGDESGPSLARASQRRALLQYSFIATAAAMIARPLSAAANAISLNSNPISLIDLVRPTPPMQAILASRGAQAAIRGLGPASSESLHQRPYRYRVGTATGELLLLNHGEVPWAQPLVAGVLTREGEAAHLGVLYNIDTRMIRFFDTDGREVANQVLEYFSLPDRGAHEMTAAGGCCRTCLISAQGGCLGGMVVAVGICLFTFGTVCPGAAAAAGINCAARYGACAGCKMTC